MDPSEYNVSLNPDIYFLYDILNLLIKEGILCKETVPIHLG